MTANVCVGQGTPSFLGFANAGNIAANLFSAVLAGSANYSCDSYSAIVAGRSNIVNSGGNGESSFIGGGDYNALIGTGAIVSGLQNSIGNSSNIPFQAFIGSGIGNNVTGSGSFVGTGGSIAYNGPLQVAPTNTVSGNDSFVGAGDGNYVSGSGSFIGAGGTEYGAGLATFSSPNVISAMDAFLGTGNGNAVSGNNSGIIAGTNNNVAGINSLIGSGQGNSILLNGTVGGALGAAYSVIAGGSSNAIMPLVSSGAKYGFVGGGHGNTLASFNGVISGGATNIAKGDYAAIPGGIGNVANGHSSFAAGSGSQALNDGTFVWSDDASGATILRSTGINQFLVRASGGVAFYSSSTLKSGVLLKAGAGSWSSLSDRASKTDIIALDPNVIVAKVAALPVSEWSYRTEDASIRHVGPMAQDFYAAFGVGEDDLHITSIDEEGIALAAIKGLAGKNRALEARVRRMELRDHELVARLHFLEANVGKLLARSK